MENIILEKIISKWIEEKELYIQHKIIYKQSILLYGDIDICDKIIENTSKYFNIEIFNVDMIELSCYNTNKIISEINNKKGDKPMFVVLENVDMYLSYGNRCKKENTLLNLLDGSNELDNIVFIGTAKDINKIDDRFKRNGRFNCKIKGEI